MSDVILVLNAGSSSIKFSVFRTHNERLMPDIRGQVEGLYTSAHFLSKTPDGALKSERSWPDNVTLGHDGALDHLVGHLRAEFSDDRLIGIGHRVVHGGLVYTRPVRVDANVLQAGNICPAGSPSSAAQSPSHSPRAGACSQLAAGGLLRHIFPSDPARCGPDVCFAGRPAGGGSHALWLPRVIL